MYNRNARCRVSKLWPSVCITYCLRYPACKEHIFCTVLYCHLSPIWLYYIFAHYLAAARFRKKVLKYEVFWFLSTLPATFPVLRRIQRDGSINIHRFLYKVPVIFVNFIETNFLDRFSKISQISNFMKIRPVEA